jgi:hypothetical protein
VLLSTLSATTGEASKLSPSDPIITQHQGHVFEDRTRDPQQMDAITQNPKAVPFVTQMPVYTGTSVPAVGQSFEMTVTFSKPVVVTGLPSLRLVLTASPSGETRYATYVGGSGTNTLTFRWDPVDVVGITGFEVTQIDQSSGSITSADGSERAESFVPSTTYTMPSYSIAVSPSVIDYTNQNSVVLNVANYGSGNMAVVSLNGNALPAVSAAASIPLDVSSLPDGIITVTYYEIANTQTLLSVSATATKDISDTIPPTVHLDPITSPSANTTQTLTGTVSDNLGTPSVVVRLSPGDITQAATVTGTAPNYTWTATVSGLSDDTYTVTARATDGMGNITDTSPQTLVINTAAPSATLSTIAGSAYTGTQILTNDATPTLAGTATGGGSASVSQVDISLDGGSTWSPATGTTNWTYTPTTNLADTIYNVQVRVTNSVGTQSVTPFNDALQVDATAPSGYSVSITPTTVNISNQTAFGFDLSGAEVGASYSYTLSSSGGGSPLTGTGTVTSASQSFSGIDVSGLGNGTLTLSLTLRDAATNTGTPATATVNKDTAGLTLSSLTATPSTLTNTGPLTFTATFSGAIDPASFTNSDVGVTNGTLASAPSTTNNITWTITVTPSAGVTGVVGIALNDDAVSTPTGNPLTGGPYSVTRPFDNVAPSVSIAITSPTAGTYTTGQVITAVATFSESVTGTADLKLQVGSNERTITCSGTSGLTRDCTYTLTSGDSGPITIAANALTGSTLQDTAGNAAILAHGAVNPSITADNVALSVSIPDLLEADDTGSSSTDNITSQATVTLNGTAKAGSSVTLYSGSTCASGSEVGTPQTATGGTYSFSSVALSAGDNTYSAKATDGVNTPVCSASGLTVTRDSIAPSVTLGSLTSPSATTTQTLSATATDAVGVTEVTFYVDSTPYTGTFNTGTWSSAPIMGFTSGAYAITAQAKDAAGNTTTSTSFSLTIDTTAPAAPSAPDLADASDSGVNTDNTTNITPVTFTGTAEAGSTVSLYAQTGCGGSAVATTTGGSYTFTGVALTANAITTFSAKATDAAGNASPCSSNLAVTHDTTAPTGTVATLSTTDTTPALSGTITEAGAAPTLTVTVNGVTYTTGITVGGTAPNYTWTLADNTITPALTVGTYNVTLNITDAAGNVGADSTTNELTVTAAGPTGCPNIGNVCSDGSIYAGLSPDLNKAMYVTPCDAGMTWNVSTSTCTGTANTRTWNDGSGSWLDTPLDNCTSAQSTCRTGKHNSNFLATADSAGAVGIQPHNAAQFCENLTAHGQTDWYLPARDELNVLYTNRTAIGGFALAGYWSSSEVQQVTAWMQNFTSGVQASNNKPFTNRVRCVRRVN